MAKSPSWREEEVKWERKEERKEVERKEREGGARRETRGEGRKERIGEGWRYGAGGSWTDLEIKPPYSREQFSLDHQRLPLCYLSIQLHCYPIILHAPKHSIHS